MPARTKSAASPGAPFSTTTVSFRSGAPAGKTTTVTRALQSEGVIRNGQEEKGRQTGRQEVAEEEGRQVVQEVGGEEAVCQKIPEEEGLEGQEAGGRADLSGADVGTCEPLMLRLGRVVDFGPATGPMNRATGWWRCLPRPAGLLAKKCPSTETTSHIKRRPRLTGALMANKTADETAGHN